MPRRFDNEQNVGDPLLGGFLPVAQRVRKNPRQFLSIRRPRRELGHSVLRQRAFDEGRDVLAAVAEGAEAVGCAELAHQGDDAVGQDRARVLVFSSTAIGPQDLGSSQMPLGGKSAR